MARKRLTVALLLVATFIGGATLAEVAAPGPSRLRGTVDSVSPGFMNVTVQNGTKYRVVLPPTVRTVYVMPAKLSDLMAGATVGTAATVQPDGTLQALEVHIFPPGLSSRGKGYHPYDLQAGATMTNGVVRSLSSTDVATVDYGKGEKEVHIASGVPVVSFQLTDTSALQPGVKVVVNGLRAITGTVTARAVAVGKDGMTPPM